jgi:hypothetical protein
MNVVPIDDDNFYVDVPKDAVDFDLCFSGMLFYNRRRIFNVQSCQYQLSKRYFYLPKKYTGDKEIVKYEIDNDNEKYNKLYIKVTRR